MPTPEHCADFDMRLKDTDSKIDAVRDDLRDHIAEQNKRHEEMMESQRLNTQAINNLTESTQGLVDAWTTANATVRGVAVIGQVLKWVAGIGISVGAIVMFFKGN